MNAPGLKNPVRIAVAGAGLIGQRHIAAIAVAEGATLAAVIDPSDAAAPFAQAAGVPHLRALEDLSPGMADGVLLATPNTAHRAGALWCIAQRLPVLVEKPIATSLDDARAIVTAGLDAGVPVLTGHHRRHNPLIAKAKEMLADGVIGQPVSAQGMFWLAKPDSYFDTEWRRQPGAGPVYMNLSHDVDLMRHFLGDVRAVQAAETRAVRGNAVEDAAVILLEFESGVLATMNVADCIPAPWSWELSAGENPAYPCAGQSCYTIGGTKGALELPSLRLWCHEGAPDWWTPIRATTPPRDHGDPLVRQIVQFARVIRGAEPPLVPGLEGLKTLMVIEAVKTAAATGTRIEIQPL